MGIKFMASAIDAKVANSGQKLVLLMLANHCNDHTRQCNPSHKLLAEECAMGLSTLKNHINSLVEAGYVEVTNVFKDNIQRPNSYLLKFPSGQNLATPQPGSGYPPGQNLATEPELKPEKNHTVFQEVDLFEVFWKAYPNKKAKENARKAFAKLKPGNDTLSMLQQAVEFQKRTIWKDKDPQYIPHAATWINGKRWEDEVQPTTGGKSDYDFLLGGI